MNDKSIRLQAQLLVLAFFVAIGLGAYAYMLNSDLNSTNAAITRIQAETEKVKADAQKAETALSAGKDAIAQCKVEGDNLRTQLEAALAAASKPTKSRSRNR